jgi:protein involved in polysaccharide export with SLBB domain
MKNAKAILVTAMLLLFALPLAAGTQPKDQTGTAGAPPTQAASTPALPLALAGQGSIANSALLHTNQDYQLRCGDLIEVKVYGEDDLATRVRLNEIGTVDLPLLPGVGLTGHTQTQACERIRQLYMKDYLVDPLISLTILEYGKSKVTVLGQVRTPGVYLFPANERLNLLQAIALAGGYTRIGEPGKIVIKRAQNGKENVIKVDGRAMAKEEGYKMFEIQPDDMISIGESFW